MFNNMIESLSVVIRNIEFIKGSFLLRRWTLGLKSLIISRIYSWKRILNWSKGLNLYGSRKGMPILSFFHASIKCKIKGNVILAFKAGDGWLRGWLVFSKSSSSIFVIILKIRMLIDPDFMVYPLYSCQTRIMWP